jgi:Family of unknown function (DUF6338)
MMGIPSNLLGLLLFVLLLWPGFVYTSVRARRMPERQTSALRETVSVVGISLTALAVVLALFGLFGLVWPQRAPSVESLIFKRRPYLRAHYVSVAWWGIGMLAVAVVGSGLVAAILTSSRFARLPVVGRLAAPDPSTMSAWWAAFGGWNEDEIEIHVGCTLDDGSYVAGRLYSYSQLAADTADRELLLMAPKIRPKGHDDLCELTGAGLMAISARHIVTMTISYVQLPSSGQAPTPAAPPAPSTTPPVTQPPAGPQPLPAAQPAKPTAPRVSQPLSPAGP